MQTSYEVTDNGKYNATITIRGLPENEAFGNFHLGMVGYGDSQEESIANLQKTMLDLQTQLRDVDERVRLTVCKHVDFRGPFDFYYTYIIEGFILNVLSLYKGRFPLNIHVVQGVFEQWVLTLFPTTNITALQTVTVSPLYMIDKLTYALRASLEQKILDEIDLSGVATDIVLFAMKRDLLR